MVEKIRRIEGKIVKNTIRTVISLNLNPHNAGRVLSDLDESTTNGLAYEFGRWANGRIVKEVGKKLSRKSGNKSSFS